ncbi:Variable major outer membrane lipoprotein (plasmid) [Borrelia coriaceae ATCC 43381]|uniref:Variable large protein n=1 Tax=Borrelia coriaceae ATCC 43381 TaxID=1408429 RepID=W5SXQ4_9SPIR|nr:variable large family protein [Borrelia coriaceae]AHH11690.1 Variable major outer membrane lipoprotein [Borrelia coriaceae ATCC 43381]
MCNIISLFLSCNNSGESVEEANLGKTMMEMGKSVEEVFYKFIELVSGTLGFTVDTNTTKEQVGEHFKKLGTKLG